MRKNELFYALFLLFGVFVSAISQVILKKAALKTYDSKIKEYINPLVITAYVMFVGTTFLSIYAYKGLPISMGPVLEATSYVYVTVFGLLFFNERLNIKKIIALLFIIVGIVCCSVWG